MEVPEVGPAADGFGGSSEQGEDLLLQVVVEVGQELLGADGELFVAAGSGDPTCDESPVSSGLVVLDVGVQDMPYLTNDISIKVVRIDDIETGAALGDLFVGDGDALAISLIAGQPLHDLVPVLGEVVGIVVAQQLEMFIEVIRDAGPDGVEITEAQNGEVSAHVKPGFDHLGEERVGHQEGMTCPQIEIQSK